MCNNAVITNWLILKFNAYFKSFYKISYFSNFTNLKQEIFSLTQFETVGKNFVSLYSGS